MVGDPLDKAERIRLEALNQAQFGRTQQSSKALINLAKKFENYIRYGVGGDDE